MKYIKNMKHIIALLFAFACYQADAQNLQFSQVLTFSGSQNPSQNYVVPNGKVWKIVAAKTYKTDYWINNIQYSIINNTVGPNDNAVQTNTFPIWLKSGDSIMPEVGYGNGFFLSIIEFSIIP